MGSIFRPKTPAPPPPPPEPEFKAFRDEINNVEQVMVKGPDGKDTIVQRRLPMSEEEKADKEMRDRIIDDSLKRIEDLTNNYDISLIDGLEDQLTRYRESGMRALDDAYTARAEFEENTLARYGQDDSTSAAITRQQRGRDFALDSKDLDLQLDMGEQQVRDSELNKSLTLYGLAKNDENTQVATALASLGQGSGTAMNLAGLGQQRNLAIYGVQNDYNKMRAQAAQQGQATFGRLLGTGVGGYLGRGK